MTSRRILLAISIVAVTALLAYLFFPHSQAPAPPLPIEGPPPQAPNDRLAPAPTATATAAASATGTEDVAAPQPPSSDQVRADAVRNPEAPSKSVIRFSIEVERKMEAALESEAAALSLFAELDHCAGGEAKGGPAVAAQVICLSNAGQLAERYSSLREKYENLEHRADQKVRQLKRMMDQK